MKMISACLCGVNCKYNGGNNLLPALKLMAEQGKALLVCPETMGGLSVPRPACEIINGSGLDVINGNAQVTDSQGRDLTEQFLAGAYDTLAMAKKAGIESAILKSRSPSCGSGKIYDGCFRSRLIAGDGVTAALLKLHNIEVITEAEL